MKSWLGVVLVLLLLARAAGGTPDPMTNAPTGAPRPGRPFVIFPITKWYPTRPPAQAAREVLVLLLFVAVPTITGLGLRTLYKRTKASGRPPGLARVVAANGLLLIFLLSLALLLGETYFRFFVDTTDSLGFTRISERWVARHWHPNAAGCRDNVEYAPLIQPGKRRVTFVGDSFTAGHGVRDVEARFANRLRAMHPDWEVHVLANVGLDTGGEINLLKKAFFRGYQLDEVVLVYCLNDVGDLLLGPGGPFEGRLPAVDQVGPWFIRGSYFLDLFYNRYQAARNPFVKDYFAFVKSGYRGEYWETQKRRLAEFRDLVQAHGGHLSVVTFPFLNALGPDYDYGFVHQELGRLWSELQVPHLDLLATYRGLSPKDLTVNAHDAHPNELANQLAADAINRTLWAGFTNRMGSVPP
jgi:hypothetical protein